MHQMKLSTSTMISLLLSLAIPVTAENALKADAVVSPNGEGDFKTVQAAIDNSPQTATADHPWVILVKPATYKERIYAQREKQHVKIVGQEPATTVITYGLYAGMKGPDGLDIGTFRTPTVMIDADNFTMENITLENNAGPVGQALALRVDGDRVAFRKCVFTGFQDTILLNRGRQYFEGCTISGAVDFIFGGATAYFEKCTLNCLRDGFITAASTPTEAPYGFVFSNCSIVVPNKESKVYLGRPWRPFASTIFLNTRMDYGVRPEGWQNWGKPEREETTRYMEFNSNGPGSDPKHRVAWAKPIERADAEKLTCVDVLGGWKP